MKEITKEMIDQWGMTNMDWMGYTLEKKEIFSYHHLIVPKCKGGKETINNGAILIQSAGHDYLHVIQQHDKDIFYYISDILIDINKQRHFAEDYQLQNIDYALKDFEREWWGRTTSKGKYLIKDRYLRRPYR